MVRAKPAKRERREPDAIDRANAVSLGIVRAAGLMKTIDAMPDGPSKRRMMGLIDAMIADLQRILP